MFPINVGTTSSKSKGGQVEMGKTLISPEIGYMAFFIDTEGNKIGLHSQG